MWVKPTILQWTPRKSKEILRREREDKRTYMT